MCTCLVVHNSVNIKVLEIIFLLEIGLDSLNLVGCG
jgi:hypothetical protein